MVDNFDDFDPGGPPPGPEPEPLSDLPADLFDDPNAPSRDAWPESDPGPHAPPAEPVPAGDGPPPAIATYSSTEQPHPVPPADVPHHPIFPVAVGFFMVAALVTACVVNYQAESAPAEAATTAPTATPTAPSPVDQLAESFKGHQSRTEMLADQVKALEARLDALPKSVPAPDLKPIETKLADLAKATAPVAGLEKRVKSIDESVADLRTAVAGLKEEVKKTATTPRPAENPKPADEETTKPAETPDPAAATVAACAPLLKANKFKEANDALRKAVEADPRDARVWYYAAMSQGKATGQWTGETVRLAKKGVEREQAGTPEGVVIDESIADLPPDLKKWVDFYRKQVRR